MSILERLENGESLKSMKISELNILADEIRAFLVKKVAENGGHLASNLGIVELTIALHYVFDFPFDKIIWDVGHQSYVHKILSGRANDFDTLRKLGGLAGFPKTSESEYDCFNTGHASTSISAAVGMAKARDLKGENNEIVAVIGDGSLSGGLAYEAINDAGNSGTRMLIILNDNKMSISRNVGGMSKHLNSLRTSGRYFRFKQFVLTYLEKREWNKLVAFLRYVKEAIKKALLSNTVFEELGLTYFGPFDGHDIGQLIKILNRVKRLDDAVIMHVRTVKGKGYAPAEKMPSDFHGVSGFDSVSGNVKTGKYDYSAVFGEKLIEIAEKNKRVTAITAAMPDGTGLTAFAKKFPKRFFDVGIAEEHAVTTAAGMAANGIVPVVAIYSTFMQRAFDSILHDVCLQNLHVVLCADRAGIVGADGETHQGVFDLSYMRMMPAVTVLAPSDYNELRSMLEYAVNDHDGPIFIRYPRGVQKREIPHKTGFVPGKAEVVREGGRVCIIACGNMTANALETAEILHEKGIEASVVDVRSVLPLDKHTLCNVASEAQLAVSVEDNVVSGGMGEEILRTFAENGVKTPLIIKAYANGKIEHGTVEELMRLNGMDSKKIAEEIVAALEQVNLL